MLKNIVILFSYIFRIFKLKIITLQVLIIFNSILQILSIISFGPLVLVLTQNEKIKEYQELYFDNFDNETFLILIIFLCIFFLFFQM
jgi:hypothetical protein